MKPVPSNKVVQRRLLAWYSRHRRDLPWRQTRDPYAILVSEVMLQQTQVDRVVPKYLAWLKHFPTVQTLARAPLRDVLRLWSGLGYNNRAARLRQLARVIVDDHGGRFLTTSDELLDLPGIGPYTARAVSAFAFNQRLGMIETNVRRVTSRVFFGLRPVTDQALERQVEAVVPADDQYGQWHHALMDLGATVCVSRRPKCAICPLRSQCRAYPAILKAEPRRRSSRPTFIDSDRFWRGEIIRQLIRQHRYQVSSLHRVVARVGQISAPRFRTILAALKRDGFVIVNSGHVQLIS